MINKELPLKYQEFKRREMTSQVSSPAMQRLIEGTASDADRESIMRAEYRARYGWDDEPDMQQTSPSGLEAFDRTISPVDDARRYAKYYKGFMRRVFHWQGKIQESETGEHTHAWMDPQTGDENQMTIDQAYVNTMATMAQRMRNTLLDAGHQKVVNEIDTNLRIVWRSDRVERQIHEEGGDTYGR